MDLIIHHANCPDGFCAALVAKIRYPEAELLGLNHAPTQPGLLERVAGKSVLMVDFSLRTREQNIELHKAAQSFHILDHHKSAKEVLDGLDFATFDMKRSGAGLTWDTLFGSYDHLFYMSGKSIRLSSGCDYIGMPEPYRPWVVNYVEDRDLWNHKLTRTKEVNAFIMTLPFTIEAWRVLESMTLEQAANLGVGSLAHVNHYVREAVEHRQIGKIFNLDEKCAEEKSYVAAVVNAPYLNSSEVGDELTKYADVAVTWFERGDGLVQFGLRSKDEIDVSKIATVFGGGGHKHAAGFQMNLNQARGFLDGVLGRNILRAQAIF